MLKKLLGLIIIGLFSIMFCNAQNVRGTFSVLSTGNFRGGGFGLMINSDPVDFSSLYISSDIYVYTYCNYYYGALLIPTTIGMKVTFIKPTYLLVGFGCMPIFIWDGGEYSLYFVDTTITEIFEPIIRIGAGFDLTDRISINASWYLNTKATPISNIIGINYRLN